MSDTIKAPSLRGQLFEALRTISTPLGEIKKGDVVRVVNEGGDVFDATLIGGDESVLFTDLKWLDFYPLIKS